jgi:hypothetical protein
MRALLREVSGSNHLSNHFTESITNVSSAEAMMQQPPPRRASAPSCDPKKLSDSICDCPSGAPVSGFGPEFRGCLGCGGEHLFRSCPMRKDPATIERFHKNCNIKFNRPQQDRRCRRKRSNSAPPCGPSPSEPPPGGPPAFGDATSPNPGSGRGAHRNQPAWMTQQHHSRTNDSPANPDPCKATSAAKEASTARPFCPLLPTPSQPQPCSPPHAHSRRQWPSPSPSKAWSLR